ncbi:MAG: hypothetical protein COS28_02980 [Nitrospirae bacterium CG02_land_8_20_14_3_00_44_33]|nr:MAG: hypothetical protein AUJ60_01090 [Nitrospirae bacterium CG1_02_44_142]PIV42790.1 MAG: hypothetical protein COS28_02980 [Nitrospirae bacterium CG02_land_8_20_14_3_00_44_33]PIV67206.1 MAG: hypothetical protein COS10_02355 [Nitrospirae bacterium CG01_land_8_20_14_3_00_44_22]PIW89578.1 MAG: hypothetical protein COZ93_04230 [Nitrospirae bacterium CG_4_8_14_3_um_filter_44_28]
MDKKRVLIVDDDSKSRKIFYDFLTMLGFEAVTADDGEDAMDILGFDPYFDLIITDVMMPYQTGFDFTKKLKERTGLKNIPVIATSAFHDWKKARAEMELPVDGFVPKPVKKEALRIEIDRVLNG